ncbi:hypothetical protein [Nocardia sp. IFM 10818]
MRTGNIVRWSVAAAMGLSALSFTAVGTANAEVSYTYTCTAEDWSGNPLPAVTVEVRKGKNQARYAARPEWRGQAKFETIECTPV